MLPGLLPETVKLLKSRKKGSLDEGSTWPSKALSDMCPPTSLWKGEDLWPMSHMSQRGPVVSLRVVHTEN